MNDATGGLQHPRRLLLNGVQLKALPEAHRLVAGYRGDSGAVRAQSQVEHPVFMACRGIIHGIETTSRRVDGGELFLGSECRDVLTLRLTGELSHFGEGRVLPDDHVVVGVAVARHQLLVVRCKHQRGDLQSQSSS